MIGLGWGVEGAAAASAIAHVVGAIIGCAIVWRRLGPDKRVAWAQVADWARVRRMLVMSRDIFIRTICVVGGLLLFRYEANRFGTDAAASIEPLYQFLIITAYALDGFSHSVEPMVGDAIGKKDKRALREAAIAAFQAGGITAAIMSGLLLLFGEHLLLLFTSIPEVLAIAREYVVYAALLPIVAVWCYLLDGMFLGAALNIAVRNAMLQAMAIYLIILFTLPRYYGLDGLWIAVMIFMGLRGVTLAFRWNRLLRSAD